MKKLLILVSGSGSNAAAIVKDLENKEVEIVIGCNRRNAGIWQRRLNVPIVHLPSPGSDFSALEKHLDENKYDLIVLAGYMRVIPPKIITGLKCPVINIHPSLLPKYQGSEDGYLDAVTHGDTMSGCTVHHVTADVDAGQIFAQMAFKIPQKVYESGTPEECADTLRRIGLVVEHQIYPRVVKYFLFNFPFDDFAMEACASQAAAKIKADLKFSVRVFPVPLSRTIKQ